MTSEQRLKKRFDATMSRLQSVCARLDTAKADKTIVVGVGDLDRKCREYQAAVDELLSFPENPEINHELAKLLGRLRVAIQDLEACCLDLAGPLDRLTAAVHDRLPDDPESADDAEISDP